MPPTLTVAEWSELREALDRHLNRCIAHNWRRSVQRTNDVIARLDVLCPPGTLTISAYACLAPDTASELMPPVLAEHRRPS